MAIYKEDLKKIYAEKYGISQAEAGRRIKEVTDIISECLVEGNDVKIAKFLNFKVKDRKAKNAINPRTKEPTIIPATRTVVVSMTKSLKNRIQGKS